MLLRGLLNLLFLCLLPLSAFSQDFGQNFQLLHAEYGADHKWFDVTERLRRLVRGQGLAFRVDGATIGDPMSGVQKILRVRYLFRGRARTDSFGDLADVRLGNPGEGITAHPPGGLMITRAEYGAYGRRNNVERLLIQAIRADHLNLVVNSANMGGDPFPGQGKALSVRYSWQGREFENFSHDGSLVALPNSNDRQATGK